MGCCNTRESVDPHSSPKGARTIEEKINYNNRLVDNTNNDDVRSVNARHYEDAIVELPTRVTFNTKKDESKLKEDESTHTSSTPVSPVRKKNTIKNKANPIDEIINTENNIDNEAIERKTHKNYFYPQVDLNKKKELLHNSIKTEIMTPVIYDQLNTVSQNEITNSNSIYNEINNIGLSTNLNTARTVEESCNNNSHITELQKKRDRIFNKLKQQEDKEKTQRSLTCDFEENFSRSKVSDHSKNRLAEFRMSMKIMKMAQMLEGKLNMDEKEFIGKSTANNENPLDEYMQIVIDKHVKLDKKKRTKSTMLLS